MSGTLLTIFLHDGTGVPPAFELDYFDSLDAATLRARQLLHERPRYSSAEISDGMESIEVRLTSRRDPKKNPSFRPAPFR
jgi:hypothetical protein